MERLGGFGSVCSAWVGARRPGMEACQQFNFGEAERRSMRSVALPQLERELRERRQAAQQAAGQAQQDEQEQQQEPPAEVGEQAEGTGAAGSEQAAGAATEEGATAGQRAPATEPNQPEAAAEPQTATAAAAGPSSSTAAAADGPGGGAPAAPPGPPFTGCIVAMPGVSPLALLRRALPLLEPSASFAVHCQYLDPLAEAMQELRTGMLAANLALQEPWFRELQVRGGRAGCWASGVGAAP